MFKKGDIINLKPNIKVFGLNHKTDYIVGRIVMKNTLRIYYTLDEKQYGDYDFKYFQLNLSEMRKLKIDKILKK